VSGLSGFTFVSAGRSDVGSVRKVNEDAWIERPEIGLWAVADGMGGHQAGDLASRIIVDTLATIPAPTDAKSLLSDVSSAIMKANLALREIAEKREVGSVIGATVVALMVHGMHFACLWAGDSRLYRYNARRLVQLTRDHSRVQDLVDAGVISAQEAEYHPMANAINRAVGAHDELCLDSITEKLGEGDIFLICSDGLSKMVPDVQIAEILRSTKLADQPAALIAAALAYGGKDNVTAVVVGVCSPE
jgi:serine/threonine protein phosphatase PrpC